MLNRARMEKQSTRIAFIITIIALVAGVYFHFKGLGKAPLAIDEYYIAISVRNILKHGWPEYDCGGFYTRGVLLQYLIVPFFKYGSHDEYYARLVCVVFNLLALPGLFSLAYRAGGKLVAYGLTTLFCLSIWEIEFARFARMYARVGPLSNVIL